MDHERFTEDDLREMVLRLAHEIRNPLATIKSGVQLVEHLIKPQGEIADYLHSVVAEVARIDRTVNDMQRFVRLDLHTAVALPIQDEIRKVVGTMARLARENGITVEVRAGARAPKVMMDPVQFQDAVSELLENAIRFSPAGSRVIISWKDGPNDMVIIQFEDQGPGVSRANEAKIMRPFFSTSTKGTGLGLNIVNRICQIYGGRLEWKNLCPCGSRFSFIIPALPGNDDELAVE
jgi:signal transduction histidine kinase